MLSNLIHIASSLILKLSWNRILLCAYESDDFRERVSSLFLSNECMLISELSLNCNLLILHLINPSEDCSGLVVIRDSSEVVMKLHQVNARVSKDSIEHTHHIELFLEFLPQ